MFLSLCVLDDFFRFSKKIRFLGILGPPYLRTKSGNHQLVIKLPIGDFELGIGVFRIGDRGFKSTIPNPQNTNTQIKIINWQFYHHLVIFTFSSLLWYHCYYPHWLKDDLSPVCGIFIIKCVSICVFYIRKQSKNSLNLEIVQNWSLTKQLSARYLYFLL